MERAYYLRESKAQGPGAYIPMDLIYDSTSRRAQKYSVPRTSRGLLEKSPQKYPGPTDYEDNTIQVRKRLQPMHKMPRAARETSFSKYSAIHSELIRKGLH